MSGAALEVWTCGKGGRAGLMVLFWLVRSCGVCVCVSPYIHEHRRVVTKIMVVVGMESCTWDT